VEPLSIEHAILGVIAQYPASGYEIKAEFEHGGARLLWDLSFGSIYPKLQKLQEQGLITPHETQQGGRERRRYELTKKGWEALAAWLAEPPAYPLPFRDELLLRLEFWGSGRPEDRQTLINHFRAREATTRQLLHTVKQTPETAGAFDEYAVITMRYTQLRLEAELTWITETIKRLEGPPSPPPKDPKGIFSLSRKRRAAALAQGDDRVEEGKPHA
jgi:DNA-binding PadR family transcriptional regulator